jgi:hypothetical protein
MASAVFQILRPVTALLLTLGLAFAALAGDAAPSKAVEGSAKYEKQGSVCVKPTEWMRRNHMEFIQHQRDRTVHQGIRIQKDSLANCVDCHARYDVNQKPVAVNAPGEFCNRCHSYAAVNITCFQCHSKAPGTETAQR